MATYTINEYDTDGSADMMTLVLDSLRCTSTLTFINRLVFQAQGILTTLRQAHSTKHQEPISPTSHVLLTDSIETQYFSFISLAFTLLLAFQHVSVICPGYNYGVGSAQDQEKLGDSKVTRCMSPPPLMNVNDGTCYSGNVYDDDCQVVDGLTTTTNPCDSGTFSCTGSPVTFNGYRSSFTITGPLFGQFGLQKI